MGVVAGVSDATGESKSLSPGRPTDRLVVSNASKTYGPAKVLDGVDLTLRSGEVHGLVGQNGSGKSTLVKILSGVIRPDQGASLQVDGIPLALPTRPAELNQRGVAFVHQDLGLIEDALVVENIRLGRLRRHKITRRIQWEGEVDRAAATLQRLGSGIDPRARLGDLRPSQRALVSIARALQSHEAGGGCIVFDESTQSLPRESLGEFYEVVRSLVEEGTSVLIVSHRLDEVLALADRVTVLRDGQTRAEGLPTKDMSESALAALLLGREVELEGMYRSAGKPPRGAGEQLIARISGPGLSNLEFRAEPGQVVGVTGSTDAGHEKLVAALGGVSANISGTLSLPSGVTLDVGRSNVRDYLAAGVAFVPEQRAAEGLSLGETAIENLTLPRIRGRNPFVLRSNWQHNEFAEAVNLLDITPPTPELLVSSFSGGNQQKLLMAKWLLNRPQVLVLHEPTQAVDVGARVDILRAIRAVADGGAAVIICSVEAQDLAFVCDEVLVLRNGAEHHRFTEEFTSADILEAL